MHPSFTSSFKTDSVAGFCRRAALFCLPLLAAGLVFELAMYRWGENLPLTRVVAAQTADPRTIFSRNLFSQQFNRYKYLMIQERRPRVLIVGSSRVMQFRALMFQPIDGVYNAGGMVQGIRDLEQLALEFESGRLPQPELIIVGIDPWWFKRGSLAGGSWLEAERLRESVYQPSGHVHAFRAWARRPGSWPYALLRPGALARTPHYGLPAMGVRAALEGQGFRADGSMLYENHIVEFQRTGVYRDRETPPAIQRIRDRDFQFSGGGLEPEALELLVSSLLRLKRAGIETIGFLPPLSSACFQALQESEDLSPWWRVYAEVLPRRLEGAIPCYAPLTAGVLGLDDRYMVDGFHPGEVLIAALLEQMVREAPAGSVLRGVDADHLHGLRTQPKAIPLSFEPPEA